MTVAYRAVTVFGAPFQGTSAGVATPVRGSYNPAGHAPRFGLLPFRSPLLPESRLISLPPGTEMFQFPGFASACADDRCRHRPGFPIRASKDHRVCAAPLGFSQLTAAFLASVYPGIPRTLSFA